MRKSEEKSAQEWFEEWTPGLWEETKDSEVVRDRMDEIASLLNLAMNRDMEYRLVSDRYSLDIYNIERERRDIYLYLPGYSEHPMIGAWMLISDRSRATNYKVVSDMRQYVKRTLDSRKPGSEWFEYRDRKFLNMNVYPGTCYEGEDMNKTLIWRGPEQALSRAVAIMDNFLGSSGELPSQWIRR